MKALHRVRHGITCRKTGPVPTVRRRNPTSLPSKRKSPRNALRRTVIESSNERRRPHFQHARRADGRFERSAVASTGRQTLDRRDDRSAWIMDRDNGLAASGYCRSLGGDDVVTSHVARASADARRTMSAMCHPDPVRASNRIAPSVRRMRCCLLCTEGVRLVNNSGGRACLWSCGYDDLCNPAGLRGSVERWTLVLPCRLKIDNLSGDCQLDCRRDARSTSKVTGAITPGIIVNADAKIRGQGSVGRAGRLPVGVAVDERGAVVGGVAKRFYRSHCLFTP